MNPDFVMNPDARLQVIYVGEEQQPILIVDDLLLHPEHLVEFAATGNPFMKDSQDFYPGIRKPLEANYADNLCCHLLNHFWSVFGTETSRQINILSSLLSLATTHPDQLRPIQSVPHFDSYDDQQIAGVHYLCQSNQGGTSFYRHRATAFERMTPQRITQYAPLLKQQVMEQGLTRFDYMKGDNSIFERIGSVEARFNRAIFYRSNILHSGNIQADAGLSEDPRRGRLTANTLLAIH